MTVIHDSGILKQMLFANGCNKPLLHQSPFTNTRDFESFSRNRFGAFAICLFATQATVHGSLQHTPEGIAFHRYTILTLFKLAALTQQRQQTSNNCLIDDRLIRANRKRFSHDYHVGEEVLKLTYQPNKLSPRAEGPYRVHQVHTNGTVNIQKDAHTIERISIRRLKPYKH